MTIELPTDVRGGIASSVLLQRTFELVHYGAAKYLPEKFKPISDRQWIKPEGGLWTSPADSEYGWRHWCEAEDFGIEKLKQSVRLHFVGKVMTIDSVADMEQLPWCEPTPGWHFPLWQPLAVCGVDAVHLTVRGQKVTRFTHPKSLYGWDCETVLVMNPACVSPCNAETPASPETVNAALIAQVVS